MNDVRRELWNALQEVNSYLSLALFHASRSPEFLSDVEEFAMKGYEKDYKMLYSKLENMIGQVQDLHREIHKMNAKDLLKSETESPSGNTAEF